MFEKQEYNEPEEEREVESSRSYDFIEETSKGLHINDYEKDALDKINDIIGSSELETDINTSILESAIEKAVISNNEINEIFVENKIYRDMLFVAGNHPSTASSSVAIHSTCDR